MKARFAIAAALIAPAAIAGGYVVPNVNPRDLSMGGSLVAAQDTAAAAYANPAALARLDGFSLSLAGSLLDFRSTWTDTTGLFGGVSSTMTPKGAFPPALYGAYGAKASRDVRWGFGAGLTVPGGGDVFWRDDWPGRSDIISADRKVWGLYLTGGVQPVRNVRLGGGLIYYRTTERLVQGVPLGPGGSAAIGAAGDAVSYDLSAEATPFTSVPLTIAVDYKHQGVQHLAGHAHFDVPDPLRPALLDQTVTHTLTFPNQLNVGASARPIEPLLVTFAWTWERFTAYRDDAFAGAYGTTLIVPRDYQNGYTLRLGAEVAAAPALRLRAGVLRDVSPSRPSTLAPSLPDASSWAFALGAGYDVLPNLAIDAAYFHDVEDSVVSTRAAFPGRFDSRTNIVSIGVVWRPDSRSSR